MGLDFDRALTYCRNLVEQVNNVGGELVLLWHNDSVQEGSEVIYVNYTPNY